METERPPAGASSIRWTVRRWAIPVGLPIAILLLFIGGPLEQLMLGWIYFPLRTIPRITIDWPTALLGIVSAVAFIAGLHVTVRWFLQAAASSMSWSWRSTLVVSLTLFLMFAAGTAMVGATHQFLWLFTGRVARPGEREAESQRRFGVVTAGIEVFREQARRTETKNRLKMTGRAIENMHETYRHFPPGGTMDETGTLMHGWAIFLANFSMYSAGGIDFSVPWNQPPNDRLYQCALREYINPSLPGPYFDDAGYGLNHYAGNVEVLPISRLKDNKPQSTSIEGLAMSNRLSTHSSITDGTSNTLLIGSVGERFKPWGHPANLRDAALGLNQASNGFGGPRHWQGGLFLMADGSVRFVSNDIDRKVFQALGTPAGGEQLPVDLGDR